MTLVELPNGVESAYTYDDADRLTDIEHVLGMDTLAFVNYTLDAVGNRTERVDGQGTHSYAYDDVYRLVEVTYPGPSTTSYVYDAFGNRTEMTVGVDPTTYAYDDADRLTSVDPPAASPVAYTWDDNGNLTDRGADEFLWDFEDRLVETTVDSVTTTFEYRGDGLRDSRTVGMTTTTFTWDIAAGIPVVLDDGTSRYVYGPSGLIAQKTSTDDFYYLADGLGSTMAITDDIGDVVRDYEYDVYGQVTGGSGSTPNEFGFAGQQSDDSTGLQYLRARYYDPETGVFLSRDPLASGPGWLGNPHGYVDANPANLTDPLGLDGSSVVGGLEQIHPCNWGWFAGKVCSEAEEAIRKLTAGLEDVLARTVAGASLIGEYGKRLATKVAGYSSEWLSDPLNLAALAVAASALAAQLACGAAVASGGVLAGACIAASLLYLEALQYRYELLREAKQEGVITQSQLVCEASTDIAAAVVPGGVLVQSGRIVFGAILCATVPK